MEFITNIQIGSNGRLGNQIFQYVILLILNKLYKISIRIPVIKTCDAYKNFRLNEIFDKLNYQILDKIPNNIPSYCEKTEFYDNNIYKLGNVNVRYLNIKGYFQSYKYLTGYEEYIKKNLVIKPSLIEFGKNYLKKIKEKHKILVGLHIRLGDYLNEFNKKIRINLGNNKFLKLFKNYFEKKFGSNIGFVLISDNINLCKNKYYNFSIKMGSAYSCKVSTANKNSAYYENIETDSLYINSLNLRMIDIKMKNMSPCILPFFLLLFILVGERKLESTFYCRTESGKL